MKPQLKAIQGTEYTVTVERDSDGDYKASITKPGDPEDYYLIDEPELVSRFYLNKNATANDLENRVSDIINNIQPSLVGVYKSNEKEGVNIHGNWDS